jgi:signal peptidase II
MAFKYKALLIITPIIFLSDQIVKWIIQTKMAIGDVISVIPGYFDIVHVTNKGAAFGMFAGSSESFRNPFFYIVSIVAVVIIVGVVIRLGSYERLMAVVFSLILGGIFGNILDRIRFGQVTDFLSVHLGNRVADFTLLGHHFNFRLEWPAFNIADSAISVAMILLVWSVIKPPATKNS